jgi:hypothetical protein
MVWSKTLDAIKNKLGWQGQADWILTDRTQFEEPAPKARPLQLVIGLDFGTAFTKVVIGEQRVRYAVPFAPYAPAVNPYLLPSALSIFGDTEECLLGFHEEADRRIDDLKMRLINRDFSIESRVHCAAFLALLLRFARGWLLDTQSATYRDRRVIWLINIGLPTESYDDRSLIQVYREIAQIAWTVSVLPGPVSLNRIKNYVGKVQIDQTILPAPIRSRLMDPRYIKTFPEFAVQLVGYVRSPRRRESLHALVDIGAGTLDFTTFNVWREREGDDLFPILARAVEPLGTRFLTGRRLSGAKHSVDWKPSPFEDMPSDAEFRGKLSLSSRQLDDIDRDFRTDVANLVREKLKFTKERRTPLALNWDSGVPMFLCGGGARIPCYIEVFRGFANARPPYKLAPTTLATPDDLRAPDSPPHTYDRLSVAYGLSYIPDDIGKIVRMEEIPDFTAQEAHRDQTTDWTDPPLTDRDAWT